MTSASGVEPEQPHEANVSFSLALLYAVTIAGFPLVSVVITVLNNETRGISIFYRALVLCLALFIVIKMMIHGIKPYRGLLWMPVFVFWSLIVLRLLWNSLVEPVATTAPLSDYYLLALGAGLIPMLACFQRPNVSTLRVAWSLTIAMAALALAGVAYVSISALRELNTTRLETNILNSISVGHLGVSLALLMMSPAYQPILQSGVRYRTKFWTMQVGRLCLFALGLAAAAASGSKGPIIGLIVPALLLLGTASSFGSFYKRLITGLFILSLFAGILAFLNTETEFKSVERFTEWSEATSSLERRQIMGDAINQFFDHPVTGSALVELNSGQYPHNWIIEAFMTTGILGGFIFLIILSTGLVFACRLVRGPAAVRWLGLLYVQYLMGGMFSGGFYFDYTFWCITATVFASNSIMADNLMPAGKRYTSYA